MIDATLHQVGRNARTQDFDSDHRRAQDDEPDESGNSKLSRS